MRGAGVGGLFALAAAFAGPAPAAGPIQVAVSPAGALSVVGTPADDQVRITRTGDVYDVMFGKGPALHVVSGCRATARNVAVCPLAGVTAITIITGEGLDQAHVGGVEFIPVPFTVSTGPGHDHVNLMHVLAPAAVDAGAGDDWVWGGVGADRIDGGDGDDVLIGMGGADTLLGGRGDDFLEDTFPSQVPDTLDCGPGFDRLRADPGVDLLLACEQPPSEWSVSSAWSKVQYRHRYFRNGTTKLRRLRVRSLPDKADVSVECRGRACPSRTWRAHPITRYSVDALGPLAGRRLRTGARVTVTVAASGVMTKVVRLTMRRDGAPALSVYCIGPISGIVTRADCRAAGLPNPGRFGF